MIVAIADDFTGAAEIGGVGLRYGLRVELRTAPVGKLYTDLLVIDSNTRSSTELKANRRAKMFYREIRSLKPELFYKKTDSVLRGNVLAELSALQQVYRDKTILLVAPNPGMGRFIMGGTYYIKGQPIHESSFMDDPEHPITSSNVFDILKSSHRVQVAILQHSNALPGKGIVLGEVSSTVDLGKWADKLNNNVIPAGGGEFFESILKLRGYRRKTYMIQSSADDKGKRLFILGSASGESRKFVRKSITQDKAVSLMPRDLCLAEETDETALEKWVNHIMRLFENNKCVLVAISGATAYESGSAMQLRKHMALLVLKILQRTRLSELYIEGGATASSIISLLNWKSFTPSHEYSSGVVRMRVAEQPSLTVTVKPGSYTWPEEIVARI